MYALSNLWRGLSIQVDYSLSCAEVYILFILALFSRTPHGDAGALALELIALATFQQVSNNAKNRLRTLASWMPDWRFSLPEYSWKSLKTIQIGSIEIDASGLPRVVLTYQGESEAGAGAPRDPTAAPPAKEPEAFEVKALATYYNRALSRATISFWFSIIFATIGFGVIVFALLSHDPTDLYATILKVVSGTVIDAVSSLFFFQKYQTHQNQTAL